MRPLSYRLLKPEGSWRIACPNLQSLCKRMTEGKQALFSPR